jgi:GATA-binding protein
MQARQELDGAPSIFELFTSAKKLLKLQDRVENRQLRKENHKSQLQMREPPVNALDLLLPMLIDDLKNGSKVGVTTATTMRTQATSGAALGSARASYITPLSMNDSPPNSGSSGNSRHNSDTPNTSELWGSRALDSEDVEMKPKEVKKSNLTSSIQQQQQQLLQLHDQLQMQLQLLLQLPALLQKQRQQERSPASSPTGSTECFNCHTFKTPLWRKDAIGNTLCNACGLFQKLHGTTRPLSLKTDVIKKRNSRRLPFAAKGSAGGGTVGGGGSSSSFVDNANGAFMHPLSRKNSMQEFASTSLPNRNSAYGASVSLVLSHTNLNVLMNSPGAPNLASRQKNVLILPKPMGAVALPAASLPRNIQPRHLVNLGSIASPQGSVDGMSVSPFAAAAAADANKRKKVDEGELVAATRRNASQVSLSSYGGARGLTLSFQSSSLNRRTSLSNFSTLQRKNSILGANNTSTPPGVALTPINIGMLNQKYQLQSESYFDTANPRHGVVSPGSEPSSLGYASNSYVSNANFNDEMYLLPDDKDVQHRLHTSNIGEEVDMDTDHFFKNYTSLQNDEALHQVTPVTRFEVPTQGFKVSSLTEGLKRGNDNMGEVKDLDWLKFEM